MEKAHRRWAVWAAAATAICLLASLDVASEVGHWLVQRVWTGLTGARIDSKQDALAWVAVLQKMVHVFLFGSLGFLLGSGGRTRFPAKLILGIAICGISEWVQSKSRTRNASWQDVTLNLVSYLTGFLVLAPLWRMRSKQETDNGFQK